MYRDLDAVDQQILREIQADGRVPNAELARRVNLSPPATLQRVRRLEEMGVVRGFHAVLSADLLGFGLLAFVMVSLELHQDRPIERFRRAIVPLPEVLECHNISGEFDFLLKVVSRDMKHYEAFVREKLSRIAGLARLHSCFVLSTSKDTDSLPLEP